jgi:stearoyl-CoA desaturase (delta-9 desaturase)
MPFDFLGFVARGLMPVPWWAYVVLALAFTHVTIACVTIFLHRSQAHRALDLAPGRQPTSSASGSGSPPEWSPRNGSPFTASITPRSRHPMTRNSPQTRGIGKVFWQGSELYRDEAEERRGRWTSTAAARPTTGSSATCTRAIRGRASGLMLMVNFMLFGALGVTIWAVQMLWIPVTAAGVINGIGHYWGYRNFASADASKNIVPWGILIGGEELHNNHHAYGTSAKLSSRWYEFDLGWFYIRVLAFFGLAEIRKVAPKLKVVATGKAAPDAGNAPGRHRQPLRRRVGVRKDAQGDLCVRARPPARARRTQRVRRRAEQGRLKRWLSGDSISTLRDHEHALLVRAMENSRALSTIYAMRQELNVLWERSTESTEQLLARLQDWCQRAEASGIVPLAQFSLQLKRYA